MKIAIPTANGQLCMHFGHCESFAMLDVDDQTKKITGQQQVPAPEHEPGLLPRWMAERHVTLVIAGGMGQRARDLFQERQITVITGAPVDTPEKLAAAYLAGTLTTGDNVCDH